MFPSSTFFIKSKLRSCMWVLQKFRNMYFWTSEVPPIWRHDCAALLDWDKTVHWEEKYDIVLFLDKKNSVWKDVKWCMYYFAFLLLFFCLCERCKIVNVSFCVIAFLLFPFVLPDKTNRVSNCSLFFLVLNFGGSYFRC